jgi:hypothetical protein
MRSSHTEEELIETFGVSHCYDNVAANFFVDIVSSVSVQYLHRREFKCRRHPQP